MASIKISQLNQATAYTLNDVVAIVDSGSTETKKITTANLLNNRNVGTLTDLNPGNFNTFISAGAETNNPSIGSQFQGSTRNSVIMGNGVINNGSDSYVLGSVEAAGGNWTGVDGGNLAFVATSFRSRINGGQETAIIASQDATINNIYDGAIIGCAGSTLNSGPGFMAGNQGSTCNGNRAAIIGSEGTTLNSNLSGIYHSYASTISGNLYNVSIGSYVGTINDLGGAMENAILLGTRESTINNQGSSMITTSGRTSVFDRTLHTDNLHTYLGNSTTWRDGGNVSGSFSVDLSTGALFSFTITGNIGTIQLDNARIGGVYEFWVYNSGSYTISSMNMGGASGTCFAPGGSVNPTNNGWTYYRLRVVDGGLGSPQGILNETLNFQAL